MLSNTKNNHGFSLLEVLIAIFILAVSTLTIYALLNMSLKVLWQSKAKITATQLANQKLELVQNLPYDQVGTIGGIPTGSIPQNEIIVRNNISFNVNTNIIYIDDPFDGVSPDDPLPTDYKRIRVAVSWNSRYGPQNLVFLTDIAPNGIESNSPGGTLQITVINSAGQPVTQADVHITNNNVSPAVNLYTQTNNAGLIILPGSPQSIENYHITVSKNGYSTDQTYNPSFELPSPDKPPLSVYENQITFASFSIDLLSNLTVTTINHSGTPLSNINLNIRGQKIIGQDSSNQPVYKFDNDYLTNTNGQIILNDIEWDSYTFILASSEPYLISEYSPPEPLNLLPNNSAEIQLSLTPQASHAVLVIVKDEENLPVADANVHLYNLSLGFNQTATTTAAGQTFFSPWIQATSTLTVTKDNYDNYNDILDINGYHIEEVILSQP